MANAGPEKEYFLLCSDFDQSITLYNSSNFLHGYFFSNFSERDKTKIEECIQKCIKVCGFKNRELTRIAFQTALRNGHQIAITTFHQYPFIIPHFLAALGLTQDETSQIGIIAGAVVKENEAEKVNILESKYGKQMHIQKAKIWAKTTRRNYADTNVILMDDNQYNIAIARENHHIAIQVEKTMGLSEYKNHLLALQPYIGDFDLSLYKATAMSNVSSSASSSHISSNDEEYKKIYFINEAFLEIIKKLPDFYKAKSCNRLSKSASRAMFLGEILYTQQEIELQKRLKKLDIILKKCTQHFEKNSGEYIPIKKILKEVDPDNDKDLKITLLEKLDWVKKDYDKKEKSARICKVS